jgi:LysM repeat protein
MRHKEQTIKQFRRLTVSLMISGALNVALLFALLYLVFSAPKIHIDRPVSAVEIPATYERTNGEILRQFRLLPDETLVQKLQDVTLIENGYTVRDLALAGLVNFHSLDLERAIGRPPEVRSLVIGKRQNGSYLTVKVFPGMSDQDFERIRFFLQTEKWPQNAQGLYLTLRKQSQPYDPSLLQAFAMTAEFRYVTSLMQGEHPVVGDDLLKLVLESDWKVIDELTQRKETGASIRQQFLLKLIEKKSKIAANVLLKTDGNYVAFRLDDAHLLMLLNLLEEKNSHVELLRTRLLASPRTDAVLAAAKKFGEEKSKESVYIVQEGDNLWKISRRFRVDVEKIKKQNRLQSDTLKPGTSLRL